MSEQERQSGAPLPMGEMTVRITADTARFEKSLRRAQAVVRRELRPTWRQQFRWWLRTTWHYWFAPLEPGGYWTEDAAYSDRLRRRLSPTDMEWVQARVFSATALNQMARLGVDTIAALRVNRTLTPAELAAFRDAMDRLYRGPSGMGTNGRRVSWWRRAGARVWRLLGEFLDQID